MTITTFGKVAAAGEAGVHHDRWHNISEVSSYSSFSQNLGNRVPVTLDHRMSSRLGEVVHAELDERGDLWAVTVLDHRNAAVLPDIERPIFYSGTFVSTGIDDPGSLAWRGRDATLEELALTFTPAMLGLKPIRILKGDVRDGWDRRHFTGPAGKDQILERAVDTVEERRRGDFRDLLVLDRRAPRFDSAVAIEGIWFAPGGPRIDVGQRQGSRKRMVVRDGAGRPGVLEVEHTTHRPGSVVGVR